MALQNNCVLHLCTACKYTYLLKKFVVQYTVQYCTCKMLTFCPNFLH